MTVPRSRNFSDCYMEEVGVVVGASTTAHAFAGVFWRLFVCYCFVFVRAQEKNTTSLVPWPCRVPTCVVLPKLDYEHTVPA